MPPEDGAAPPRRALGGTALASLIRKSLRSRRTRAALAVVGVATSTLLVLVLLAAFRNPILSITSYVGQPGIHLWVGPEGTDNLVRTSGFLPLSTVDSIRAMPGVAAADPLVRVFVRASPGKRVAPWRDPYLMLLAFGYRVPDGLAGPPEFAAGRAPHGESEVALDRAAAFRLGVGLGDTLIINGREARIAGLTSRTNVLATQFLFFDIALAERASGLLHQISLVAVRLRVPADSAAVARSIEELYPWTAVLPRDQFLRNNLRETASGVLPVLMLIAVLGVVAASALVALLIQGLVEDRRSDIAVLMAMGAGLSSVAAALVVHATLLVAAGSAAGGLLSIVLGAALDRWLPTVQLVYVPTDVITVSALFALAGVAGSLVPILRLRHIDPLEAFRT